MWSVRQCSQQWLAPEAASTPAHMDHANILLAVSDHSDQHSSSRLLHQVERILRQLHVAQQHGMLPAVFMGELFFAPTSCAVGANPYFSSAAGDNIWAYYFAPVGGYEAGTTMVSSRPARVFVASAGENADNVRPDGAGDADDADDVSDAMDLADATLPLSERVGEAPTTGAANHLTVPIRRRLMDVRRMARLVRQFMRVRPPILVAAARLLQEWRQTSDRLLGVAFDDGGDGTRLRQAQLDRAHRWIRSYTDAHVSTSTSQMRHGVSLVVVGANAAELAWLRQRHSIARVRSQPAPDNATWARLCHTAMPSVPDGPRLRARSGPCVGLREVVDALLLAHCDYLIAGRHDAAEFALWYNPMLHAGHLDLALSREWQRSRLLPRWAGGAWEPPGSMQSHSRRMLRAALSGGGRSRGEDSPSATGIASSAAASDASMPLAVGVEMPRSSSESSFVPGLLPKAMRRKRLPPEPWRTIESGRCGAASPRTRVMTFAECADYARITRKHFLGRSVEAREYPGCNVWQDTQDVEFNDHAAEGRGCNIAPRGHCICHVG